MGVEEMPASYAKRVGDRLRAIRLQKDHSLHEVEDLSAKEFKASVLGAYERGERSISVPRLQRLAMFYGVPVDQLLPKIEDATIVLESKPEHKEHSVRLDLSRLRDSSDPVLAAVSRFAGSIQAARGDYNGRVLTIRGDDVRILAAAVDVPARLLSDRLDQLGVRISAPA